MHVLTYFVSKTIQKYNSKYMLLHLFEKTHSQKVKYSFRNNRIMRKISENDWFCRMALLK